VGHTNNNNNININIMKNDEKIKTVPSPVRVTYCAHITYMYITIWEGAAADAADGMSIVDDRRGN